MAPARRKPARDAVLVGAVEVARAAAIETADHPQDVGDHVDATMIDDRLVAHRFASGLKGYAGWYWTVVLARAPRARTATICEVALLPGDSALLAPDWLPWAERLQPSDIGPGHVLPFEANDPRLVPGYRPSGIEDEDSVAIEELALARARVLSEQGIREAANRWYESDRGPATAIAVHSSAPCGDCGFLIPLQGSLGQIFGVCANAWSPEDGRVVSLDHGCGAHSETDAPKSASQWPDPDPMLDEVSIDVEVNPVANAVAAATITETSHEATAGESTSEDNGASENVASPSDH